MSVLRRFSTTSASRRSCWTLHAKRRSSRTPPAPLRTARSHDGVAPLSPCWSAHAGQRESRLRTPAAPGRRLRWAADGSGPPGVSTPSTPAPGRRLGVGRFGRQASRAAHLHREWLHPSHILHRDWAHLPPCRFEVLFRSINQLLLDAAAEEHAFCTAFFDGDGSVPKDVLAKARLGHIGPGLGRFGRGRMW